MAAILMVLSLFGVFSFLGEKQTGLLLGICALIVSVSLLQPFFYRNHVQWNKRGINIRINEFWGKNYSFDNIKLVNYKEDQYTIITDSGKSGIINLEGIDGESKSRLLNILQSHTEG